MSDFIEIFAHKSFWLTVVLTLFYFGLGFAFLHFGLVDYGGVIFILLPFSLGIVVGKMENQKWAHLGLAISMLIFFVLLVIGGLEGIVCIFMAIPIVLPLVWLGTKANKYLVNKGLIKPTNDLPILAFPLVILFFGGPIEKYFNLAGNSEIIEVTTERIYPYTPEQVYNAIKSVDTLIADKPFLMKLDLPIPTKCVLEKEEVGGLRTCYFEGGTITEQITELEKAKVLRMDVIDYQLTGRKWLVFKEAIYYFEEINQASCKLTRITTYTSALNPRFYWEPLERIGINQEHDYVFDNLNNDLKRKY